MKTQKQKISNGVKKIFVALFLITFLAGVIVPVIGLADTTGCCKIKRTFKFGGDTWTGGTCYGEVTDKCVTPEGETLCDTTTAKSNWGAACILNTVYKIVDLIFALLIAVAVLIGLVGAYNILTAAGDAAKINKGRDYIIYAIIGVIVAFFARAIPSIIAMLI